jgi:hypothetical protein
MKRTIIALATMIALTGAADAQHRGHRGYSGHGYRGGWAAPLVGGLLLGGALGYYGYQDRYYARPRCYIEVIGYDRYGREILERFCQ